MDNIQIKPIETSDKDWISLVLEKQWGSVNIVTRGKIHQADKLPGYIAFLDDKKIGLINKRYKSNILCNRA